MRGELHGAIQRRGSGLHRPECVVPSPSGDVYVPDWRGGVAVVRADGTQHAWLARDPGFALRPNGIALTPQGDFLIANLGDDGGIWRLSTGGDLTPYLLEVDGVPIPPANFVFIDELERVWISVSTRLRPRQRAWNRQTRDGFVVLVDQKGARVVADGIGYTNEVRIDPSGRWLYVVETYSRGFTRYPIAPDGALGAPQPVANFADGTFPDGFCFDVEGGIWITSLITGRLLRLGPDGRQTIMIEEDNLGHVPEAEAAFAQSRLEARHLAPAPGTLFGNLTSVGFGGPDMREGCLGTLDHDAIFTFRSPVAGVPPPHWRYPMP